MKLKDQVEQILRDVPATRDSDIRLTLNIWKKFYPDSITLIDGQYFIRAKDLYDIPREDTVKRLRAKLNEEDKYLSTNPEIMRKRRQKEQEWREELGYAQ